MTIVPLMVEPGDTRLGYDTEMYIIGLLGNDIS
jgi:hypothetical protein